MFRLPLGLTLIWFAVSFCQTNAQQRYAMDAAQGCRGVVPADPSLSPPATITGEVWVNLMNDAPAEQVILRTDCQPGNWSFKVVNGRAKMSITLSNGLEFELTGNTPLPLGAWAHIAGCYGGGSGRLFLNGREETVLTSSLNPAEAPGPILFGGSAVEQCNGLVDEVRLSNIVRYAEDFDPFVVPLLEVRVADQQVTGWELGTDPGDLTTAWDSLSLWNAINGAGIVYLEHNFQFWMRQYYQGQIGGQDVDLDLRMNDQGTPEDAEALYNDPLVAPPVYQIINNIGDEARLVSALFDFVLEFRRDQYYVYLVINKEYGELEARQTILTFGAEADTNIVNRFENIVALWHFDEGTGDVFSDATGNGFDGSLSSPVWAQVVFSQPVLYITSAQVTEGAILDPTIDEDDTARITFSEPVVPIVLSASNIDAVLPLSGGHSWLSGAGQLGSVMWNSSQDTLEILFDLTLSAPTITGGDTLTPNPDSLISTLDHPAGGYRFVRFEGITGVNPNNCPTYPEIFKLSPPIPNPFNSAISISLELPSSAVIALRVFDLNGREVQVLHNGFIQRGIHSFTWDACESASGIYFIALQSGGMRLVRKVALIR